MKSRGEINVLSVPPLGTQRKYVNRGGFEAVQYEVHPPSPRGEAFRKMRVDNWVGLREAAAAIGIPPLKLAGVEHGRFVFATEEDWEAATRLVWLCSKRRAPNGTAGPA